MRYEPSWRSTKKPAGPTKIEARFQIFEMAFVLLGVVALMLMAPLGSDNFVRAAYGISGGVALYLIVRIALQPKVVKRWGMPFTKGLHASSSLEPINSEVLAITFPGAMWMISVFPIMLIRFVVPGMPELESSSTYLVWVGVQDFLFFAFLLRNLADRMPHWLAIGIAAVAFGLSHYPMWPLAGLSFLGACVWGWAYLETGSFLMVVVAHYALGLTLLG